MITRLDRQDLVTKRAGFAMLSKMFANNLTPIHEERIDAVNIGQPERRREIIERTSQRSRRRRIRR